MVTLVNPGLPPITISTKAFDLRMDKYDLGEGYVAGLTGTAPAAATNNVMARIANPSSATKTLRIYKLILSAATINFFQYGKPVTPALAALANVVVPNVKKAGGAAAVGTFTFANNSAQLPPGPQVNHRVAANTTIEVLVGVILPPNSSWDLGAADTTTADTVDIAAEWYEE